MRYVEEILRNVVAEFRLWLERRRPHGPASAELRASEVTSPAVAGLVRPVDAGVTGRGGAVVTGRGGAVLTGRADATWSRRG